VTDRIVVVTGATGFVGAYLVPALLEAGWSVRALARTLSKGVDLKRAGAELHRGDLLEPDSLRAALRGATAVVHLAAVADSSDGDLNHRVNVVGSANLVAACRAEGVARIVNVSSTCAGRDLQDAYGRSKLVAEAEFAGDDLQVTHLRPAMIYGHGSAEFDLFAAACKHAPRVPIPGNGRCVLRPVYVDDFVALVLRVLEREAAIGATYDVAGPDPIVIDDFVELLGRAQGRRRKTLHVPARLAILGARVLGRVQQHPFINVDQVMAFLQDTVVDIDPARRDLGWDPRPIEVGLDELFGEAR
jgi:nucleoside-diphosphate-sugar epimerase